MKQIPAASLSHAVGDAARERGNKAVKLGRFQEAWEHYSEGLCASPNQEAMVVLLANRSVALLGLQRFQEALADCDGVLAVEPEHKKVIFRRGKALIALARYAEAVEALNLAALLTPGSSEVKAELKCAQAGKAQSVDGKFDFRSMLAEAALKETLTLQHSSPVSGFTSKLLEVAELSEKDRAYVAKRSIRKGELIVMAKPLVFASYPELTGGNANILVHKLMQVGDCKQARSLSSAKREDPSNLEALSVDEAREVLSRNCVACATGVGLWHAISFFNHSDSPNAVRFFIADWAMVRAKDDIGAGEEVTVSYIDATAEYASQVQYLSSIGVPHKALSELETRWTQAQEPHLLAIKSGELREQWLAAAGDEESPGIEQQRYLELVCGDEDDPWCWGQLVNWLKDERTFRRERKEPRRALGAALAVTQLLQEHMGLCSATLEAWADCSALLFELPEASSSGEKEEHGEAFGTCIENMAKCIDFAFGEDYADEPDFSTLVLEWATVRWHHAAAWKRQSCVPMTQDAGHANTEAEVQELDDMD